MTARVRIANLPVARVFLDAGQSVMLLTSHLCNWEWLLHGVALQLGYPVDAAYKPLHDAWAERLMLDVRSRFGARLIPAKERACRLSAAPRRRARPGNERRPGAGIDGQALLDPIPGPGHGLLRRRRADRPRHPSAHAVSGDAQGEAGLLRGGGQRLWDGREVLEPNAITERYARACEADVLAHPADWLWSYRRWKLKKPLYGADS